MEPGNVSTDGFHKQRERVGLGALTPPGSLSGMTMDLALAQAWRFLETPTLFAISSKENFKQSGKSTGAPWMDGLQQTPWSTRDHCPCGSGLVACGSWPAVPNAESREAFKQHWHPCAEQRALK